MSVLLPAETANGTNRTFTFSSSPKFLVVDGEVLRRPDDYALSGNVVTIAAGRAAPAFWVRGYA